MLPIKAPIANRDAIQEASSIEILPDGSEESSDNKSMRLGLVQPDINPYAIVNKFAKKIIRKISIKNFSPNKD